jgi:hypothetical protein
VDILRLLSPIIKKKNNGPCRVGIVRDLANPLQSFPGYSI